MAHRLAAFCGAWVAAWSWCHSASGQARPAPNSAAANAPKPTAALPDADIRTAVLDELAADRHLVASNVGVSVKNGIAQLSGDVPVLIWRERAARVTSVVKGVRGVVNRIRVVPMRRPDQVVAREAREAVRRTVALTRMPIVVRVTNGVVELDGRISSFDEQQLAERVVSAVPGVRYCHNQLSFSAGIKRTSTIIAADVQSRLDWDPLVQHDPIRVTARGGLAILTGRAGSLAEHRRAVADAWVKGVKSVDANALVVDAAHRPDENLRESWPSDPEISRAIQDLGSYWPSITGTSWQASVTGGVVTLRGTTQTVLESRAIQTLVRSAVGVTDVKSELRGPWWRAPVAPPPSRPPRRKARP